MKKTLLLVFAVIIHFTSFATIHNITLSGFSFSPSNLVAFVGDTLNIEASNMHPVVQVSEATWNDNGTLPLFSGWGSSTTTFEHVITTEEDIYYVCANHVGGGMKGQVTVQANQTTGIQKDSTIETVLFPNPTNDRRFSINIYKSAQLELYSVEGKLVESHKVVAGKNSIFTKVSIGNYLYVLTSEAAIMDSGKLIVN